MNPTKNLIEPKPYMNPTKNLIEPKLYMNPSKNLIEAKPYMNPTKNLIEPKLYMNPTLSVKWRHMFSSLVVTSADSVPSSYLVRITIGTTFGNLQ